MLKTLMSQIAPQRTRAVTRNDTAVKSTTRFKVCKPLPPARFAQASIPGNKRPRRGTTVIYTTGAILTCASQRGRSCSSRFPRDVQDHRSLRQDLRGSDGQTRRIVARVMEHLRLHAERRRQG